MTGVVTPCRFAVKEITTSWPCFTGFDAESCLVEAGLDQAPALEASLSLIVSPGST